MENQPTLRFASKEFANEITKEGIKTLKQISEYVKKNKICMNNNPISYEIIGDEIYPVSYLDDLVIVDYPVNYLNIK